MRLTIEHNLSDTELIKAFTATLRGHGLQYEALEALEKAAGEEVPERWLREILREMDLDRSRLDQTMLGNIRIWLAHTLKIRRGEKPDPRRLRLDRQQLDELQALIMAHYRAATSADLVVTPSVLKRWRSMGIVIPDGINLIRRVNDIYVAGRLASIGILQDRHRLKDLEAMLPDGTYLSRIDQLAIEAARQGAARYVQGIASRITGMVDTLALEKNRAVINNLITQYRERKLHYTGRPDRPDIQPEEFGALETGKIVNNWRQLASELRNRMQSVEHDRDWQRVAVTEARAAYNIGALQQIAEQDGLDQEIYFLVQPDACAACKKLYLMPSGAPRTFRVKELIDNITRTGGFNYGRKAKHIGDPELGYIANAVVHPWCRCRPRKRLRGVEPTSLQHGQG